MGNREEQIEHTSTYIQKQTALTPKIGIILGTGMGQLINHLSDPVTIPYSHIPGFPQVMEKNKEAQEGEMVIGKLAQKPVLIMSKRFHYYEGYTSQQISFPIRTLKCLGIQTMIICNCAGGLNPLFKPGELMIIIDHINFMGTSPLIGPNLDTFGQRFPDMKDAYNPHLITLAGQIALEEKIPLNKGVYAAVLGPNLETPAETRFLRSTGADAVGMSTVPEVIVGVHANMRILGFSIIGNVNLPDAFTPINQEEVVSVANKAESSLIHLIQKIVAKI